MKSPFSTPKRVVVLFAAGMLIIGSSATYRTLAVQPDGQAGIAAPVRSEQFIYPRIKGHGKVVHLPDAADQPRAGSKICVDVTTDGAAEEVNPAVEKAARFINIYAGAGKQSAEVAITVVLHGNATQVALSDVAYRRRFQTDGNPNTQLIQELKDAGVEFLVCGQALTHKGFACEEVGPNIEIAVSALTVNVNRQTDGYAVVQLR